MATRFQQTSCHQWPLWKDFSQFPFNNRESPIILISVDVYKLIISKISIVILLQQLLTTN